MPIELPAGKSELSDEELIKLYRRIFGLSAEEAEKAVLLERGEIGGDIIQINPDGSETTFLPELPNERHV